MEFRRFVCSFHRAKRHGSTAGNDVYHHKDCVPPPKFSRLRSTALLNSLLPQRDDERSRTNNMSKPARLSYWFILLTLMLMDWLHMATPFIAALFSYFVLEKLHFVKNRWLAVL